MIIIIIIQWYSTQYDNINITFCCIWLKCDPFSKTYYNLGLSSETFHLSVAQQLHLEESDGLTSVINHTEPALVSLSLLLSFRLSVSVLPRYSVMIHNHRSMCLHQHPSLFMEFHSQGLGAERWRERRRRRPSSQGQREGYSAVYFQMTSQLKTLCTRFPVLGYTTYLLLSGWGNPADLLISFE